MFDRVFKYLKNPNDPDGLNRVILCMPPQNGKSEIVSRNFPAFVLGNRPNTPLIACSYSYALSSRLNRDVQRIITSEQYQKLFPRTRLNEKNIRSDASGAYLRNNDIFEIVGKKGYYLSAGVGGPITGSGFELGIIDDPTKNQEEAQSEQIQDGIWEWYTTTFYTRMRSDQCAIVLMATRWADRDLIGRLLAKCNPKSDEYDPKADKWYLVNFPARLDIIPDQDLYPQQFEALKLDQRQLGEALWPQRYSLQFLETTEAQDNDAFMSLYQQWPSKPGGALFRDEYFKVIDWETLKKYANGRRFWFTRYWDKAATAEESATTGSAFTVGTLLLTIENVGFFIIDVRREQKDTLDRETFINDVGKEDIAKYGAVSVFFEREGGGSGKDSAKFSTMLLAGLNVEADLVQGSKTERAIPVAKQCKAGNVYLVATGWDISGWKRRVCAFPGARFKDEVDSLSGAFNKAIVTNIKVGRIEQHDNYVISPI